MPPVVHPQNFKHAMRTLAGGVTVLASKTADGQPWGITATAVCSLSAEPPSVLICVNKTASLSPLIQEGGAISVNILTAEQEAVARAFGGMTPAKGAHRFISGNWVNGTMDVPVLADARCALECTMVDVIERFTHRIAVCVVHEVHLGGFATPALVSDHGRMVALPF